MGDVAEIIGLLLFTAVKFLFGPSTTYALGYSFWETMVISVTGGWFGVALFYYAGSFVFNWWSKVSKPNNRKFSKKNRLIVWFKNDFGLYGVAVILGIGSIPIVALLAAKYFRHNSKTIYLLLLSVIVWSFALTGFSVWLVPIIQELF